MLPTGHFTGPVSSAGWYARIAALLPPHRGVASLAQAALGIVGACKGHEDLQAGLAQLRQARGGV